MIGVHMQAMQVLVIEDGAWAGQPQTGTASAKLLALGLNIVGNVHMDKLAHKLKTLAPEIVVMATNELATLQTAARLLNTTASQPAWVVLSNDERLACAAMLAGAHGYAIGVDALDDALKIAQTPNAAQRVQMGVPREHIAARTHRGVELIHLENVYYFCADQKYVRVRHKDGTVLVDNTLKQLETQFAPKILRVHRNALINLRFLEALESMENGQYRVRLRGLDEPLQVSRRHLSALKERIYCL